MSLTSPGKALRAVFDSPETALVPFGALPLHAQMAQHAGYEAFQLSGGISARWEGVSDPDIGVWRRLPQRLVCTFYSRLCHFPRLFVSRPSTSIALRRDTSPCATT